MSVATSKGINPQAVPSRSFESVKAFIERRAVLTYFVLVFIISWGVGLILVGPGGFPLSWEKFETVGTLVFMASLTGPCLAGILLTGLIGGRAGFRDFFSRLFRWRVGARWYVVALLTAPLLTMAIALMLSIASPRFLPAIFSSEDKTNLLLSGIAAGLLVGFFEEVGWTGFAVPRLLSRHSIFATGLIVGLVWGAWHFPLFWESNSFTGALPLSILLINLFSWTPAFRGLMVWVYDRTGSLLVTILMHASLSANQLILRPTGLTGVELFVSTLVWPVALWLIVAAVARIQVKASSRQSVQERAA